MTIQEWLEIYVAKLKLHSDTPRLDAELLLCKVLSQDRAWIIAHQEFALQGPTLQRLDTLAKQREKSIPMAYILGTCEFYGRSFAVNNNVLVPRPESETIIELLMQEIKNRKLLVEEITIADIGTGSGVLGITASLELQNLETYLIDIDQQCLDLAKENADTYSVSAKLLQGDLLQPYIALQSPSAKDMFVLANLPYVPVGYEINDAAKHEPELALFGGRDGLSLYQRMFSQLNDITAKSILVITESLPFQHSQLSMTAKQNGFDLCISRDLAQVFTRDLG